LEAKLDKPPPKSTDPHLLSTFASSYFVSSNIRTSDCPRKKDWFRLWLDIWQLGSPAALKCWADDIQLHFDPKTGKNCNTVGVKTRVPGWGTTDSVEYLDPSWSAWVLKDCGNYAATLVKHFVDHWGYVRGKSIRAAPYDFRFAPPSQGDYFQRLKLLVEETRALNDGEKVVLMSHSLGGLFALYFLNSMDVEWKRDNIWAFIPIGTPWAGTTAAFNIFAAGYDMGISAVDPRVIRAEQRSYETGAELLPHPRLTEPADHAFLSTPLRNFTAQTYPAFFEALKFPVGKINHDNVLARDDFIIEGGRRGWNLKFPDVDVVCIYSKGVSTMSSLIYDSDSSFLDGDQPSRYEFRDGDGTVNLASLDRCEAWSQIRTNCTFESKVFPNLDHLKTLKSKLVFDYVKRILIH